MSFHEWLNEQIANRDWSQNKLSVKAGLSRGEISRIMNGKTPSFKVCTAIAGALDISVDLVLKESGLQSKPPGYDEKKEGALAIITLLNDSEFEELVEYAKMKIRLRKEKESESSKKKRKG